MEVILEKFSGPLDLLLRLIEEQKLEITDIALAEVTDQYLTYLEKGDIEMGTLADFLVIASKLLLIKSRALLPSLTLSQGEEEEIRDFTEQLKEYQRYRQAMRVIREFALSDKFVYTRPAWSGLNFGFFPPEHLEGLNLTAAIKKIVDELWRFFQPLEERLIARRVSIEDKIMEVTARIEKKARVYLQDLARGSNKSDIILAFLALLFLFKEKILKLTQKKRFGEISIIKEP